MDTHTIRRHPGHAALRRGRCSIPGQPYLITTTTAHRRPQFLRWPIATAVAAELAGPELWRGNRNHAWVLMPDHMHALVTLGGDESLDHLLARVKAVCARTAHLATRDHDGRPFWARAFHDRALRRDESMREAARYIIANPVRAGLTEDIWTWPFWGCEWIPRSSLSTRPAL